MVDAQTIKMVVTLGALYLVKQMDATDPDNLFWVRVLYATVQTCLFCSYAYMKMRISNDDDQRELAVSEGDLTPQPAMAAMMGAPAPSSDKTTMTVQQYDVYKLMAVVKAGVQAVCITSFIHYKYEYMAPLVLQSVMGLMTLFTSELGRIHLLGQREDGDGNESLARPWKAAPGMMDQIKKAKEEAEAASNGGAIENTTKAEKKADKKAKKKAVKKAASGTADKMD